MPHHDAHGAPHDDSRRAASRDAGQDPPHQPEEAPEEWAEPMSARGADEAPTPDDELRTGAENPVDPEDLVRLSGREPTPELIEEARRRLAEEGAAAVERYLP